MRTDDAIEFFGSAANLARALGITIAAVSQWGEQVPELRAHQLEKISNGKLKAPPINPCAA